MKNCISRRSFLKAAGILSAAGALAACGGSSSSSTAASSTASSAAASSTASAGASIKLWTYPIGGWGNDETVQNLVSSFNAKYPDIKVTVEYLDYTNGAAPRMPAAFRNERREMQFFIVVSPSHSRCFTLMAACRASGRS